ncbi:MAG: SGNH/GDSL hydrolase family protein [Gemmatimonadota bacterium]
MIPLLRILCLGDSYTIGESVAGTERWPVQLVAQLRARGIDVPDPVIIAKTGWTTGDLNAAIDETQPQGPFELVTLLIGVNNQYRGLSPGEYRAEFRALLSRAIGFAGGRANHVIVLSIPDWGVTPFAASRDRLRIGRDIDAYNSVNQEETARLGAAYVDITPISREAANAPSLTAPDGLHPSGEMYRLWAEIVYPETESVLKQG